MLCFVVFLIVSGKFVDNFTSNVNNIDLDIQIMRKADNIFISTIISPTTITNTTLNKETAPSREKKVLNP